MSKTLNARKWLGIVLIGLFGQFAWTIENMYFNVFLYNTISTDPGYIASMVAWSATVATLTTLLMGALSDRLGRRKALIALGYVLWGVSTGLFGFITPENAARLFPGANAAAAAAILVVVLDCVMTFFGSTANDAAFNAYITDVTDQSNRGRVESVLAILPLISMLVIFGLFDSLTQQGRWKEFFGIFGIAVSVVGLLSLGLIRDDEGLKPRKDSTFKNLLYGLRPGVVKENPELYLSFAAFCLFSIAVQVFFPYLIIYIQNYLGITDYALILGVVLILASVISVVSGRFIDRMGKLVFVFPAALIMLLLFIPKCGRAAEKKVETQVAAERQGVPVSVVLLVVFFGMLMFFTAMVSLPIYLQNDLGYSPSFTGNYLAALDLISVLAAGVMPKLVAKIHEKGCLLVAFLCYGIAFVIYFLSGHLAALVIAVLFAGAGFGLSTPLFNSLVVRKSAPEKKGTNISLCTMAMFSGQFLSALLVSVFTGRSLFAAAAIIALCIGLAILPVAGMYQKKGAARK